METFTSSPCSDPSGNLGIQNCQDEHFLYFAYGSNLLRERIRLSNPSIIFHVLGSLLGYKLAFGSHLGKPSSTWHGSTATIIQSPSDEVWGVVWRMNISDLCSLDKQEGVEDGLYVPIDVDVRTEEGKVLKCRCYQMTDYVYGLPSPQYKKVICMGAKQNGLPSDYRKKLDAIETNNYEGPLPLLEEIEAALNVSEKTQ
ncbi:gamma-glutamylcyclotransferase [Tiliqua scincoides]|uniref:gamma-glutamylcyclotransferase n=1 Tax=Tiliqua scincoides TaxID=71010 RepID=UPI00346261DB